MKTCKTLIYGKAIDMAWKPDNQKEWLEFLLSHDGKKLMATFEKEKGVRTLPQNNALHLWFDYVSKELNEKGFTLQKILAMSIEINWTPELVKTVLWKSVQEAITGKKSTTQLDKVSEIDTVYEHLNRFFAEKCNGIHIPFPNKDQIPSIGELPSYTKQDNKTAF